MRTPALVTILLLLAGSAQAQTTQVTGTLGYLSEWEMTGKVSETLVAGRKEFAGPLTVRHVGVCTPGRPVEMTGEIRYHMSGWMKRRITATVVIDGTECSFDATLADRYDGVMSCAQWRGVPLSLSLKSAD
jgi:hypothetical protein